MTCSCNDILHKNKFSLFYYLKSCISDELCEKVADSVCLFQYINIFFKSISRLSRLFFF